MIRIERDLKELAKEFILEDDIEQENIQLLVSDILKFCKIDKRGYVVITEKKLKTQDKIMLILSARYLASKLQEKINSEITIDEKVSNKELVDMLKEKDMIIGARLRDLREGRVVEQISRGVHRVCAHAIEGFLGKLEEGKNGK